MKILILVLLIITSHSLYAATVVSLEDAGELLLSNNPEYLGKQAELSAAEWEKRQALMSLFPRASFQAGMNYMDPLPPTVFGAKEDYAVSYGFQLNQPLFMGGRLWNAYRISVDAYRMAKADYDNAKLSLIADMEEAYFDYLLVKELYEINEAALKIARQNLETARANLEAGTISSAGLYQMKSEYSAREVSLLQARNSKKLAYRRLGNYLKIDDFEVQAVDLEVYQDFIAFYQELTGEALEEAKNSIVAYGKVHNPLLTMSRAGLDMSRRGVRISKGSFLPAVNLSAARTWNDRFTGMDDFNEETTFMITASVPLFPVYDNYSGYRSGRAAYIKAEKDAEAAEDGVLLAIEAAFYSGVTAAKNINSTELALRYAEETYRMMGERYQSGLISTADFLGIEMLLRTSRMNAANSKYEFLKNRSTLMNLLNIESSQLLLQTIKNNISN